MGFIHNIDPVLFSFGPMEIRYYGLVYALGFLLAYFWVEHFRKKGRLLMRKEDSESFVIYIILGGIIGGRIFHVIFWQPGYFIENPLDMVKLWNGGMSYHGGILGASLAAYYFCRRNRISFPKLADVAAMYLAFIFAVGRIANFINGELWGTVTKLPWCVEFKGADGCRHPYQIYSAAKRFIIMGVLLAIDRKRHKPGFLFWLFILFSGVGRFALDFVREDARWFGLAAGQYLSILMVAIAGYMLFKYYKRDIGLKHQRN